ncbi:MAG: hypothetical protein NUK65_12995 [Firmicutes bacterium]|nr:hypothetical protein [Bacillota bacterium]
MIILLGRKLYRLLMFFLILLIILPLLQFYAVRIFNPHTVSFREPRGQAIKVVASEGTAVDNLPVTTRFLYFLHEFYQNGL